MVGNESARPGRFTAVSGEQGKRQTGFIVGTVFQKQVSSSPVRLSQVIPISERWLGTGTFVFFHHSLLATDHSPVIHQHIPEQEAKYSGHSDLFFTSAQNSQATIRVQNGLHHIKVVAQRYCRGEFSRCCPRRPQGRRGRDDLKTVENRFFAIAGIFSGPRRYGYRKRRLCLPAERIQARGPRRKVENDVKTLCLQR